MARIKRTNDSSSDENTEVIDILDNEIINIHFYFIEPLLNIKHFNENLLTQP